MGKNRAAYSKAVIADQAAANRQVAVNGGSTKEAYNEALVNSYQANAILNEAKQNFQNDPEG